MTLKLQVQEILSAQQLAQLAPPGSAVQHQLGALAGLHGRVKLGKPTLIQHFHMGPDFASEDAYEQDLAVHW